MSICHWTMLKSICQPIISIKNVDMSIQQVNMPMCQSNILKCQSTMLKYCYVKWTLSECHNHRDSTRYRLLGILDSCVLCLNQIHFIKGSMHYVIISSAWSVHMTIFQINIVGPLCAYEIHKWINIILLKCYSLSISQNRRAENNINNYP